MTDDDEGPTHIAYAVSRVPGYPLEWVKLGPVIQQSDGSITGRFISAPTSAWGWEWCAVPVGCDPPPLGDQSQNPVPLKPSRPLPGMEDDEVLPGWADDEGES